MHLTKLHKDCSKLMRNRHIELSCSLLSGINSVSFQHSLNIYNLKQTEYSHEECTPKNGGLDINPVMKKNEHYSIFFFLP